MRFLVLLLVLLLRRLDFQWMDWLADEQRQSRLLSCLRTRAARHVSGAGLLWLAGVLLPTLVIVLLFALLDAFLWGIFGWVVGALLLLWLLGTESELNQLDELVLRARLNDLERFQDKAEALLAQPQPAAEASVDVEVRNGPADAGASGGENAVTDAVPAREPSPSATPEQVEATPAAASVAGEAAEPPILSPLDQDEATAVSAFSVPEDVQDPAAEGAEDVAGATASPSWPDLSRLSADLTNKVALYLGAPVFWLMVAGYWGAALYVLNLVWLRLYPQEGGPARPLHQVLYWIPSRLLTLCVALVGDFGRVMDQLGGRLWSLGDGDALVGEALQASLPRQQGELDSAAEREQLLAAAQRLLQRTLALWLILAGVWVIIAH